MNEDSPPGPCRILLAESSPQLRRFMTLLLEGDGHVVIAVGTAGQATTFLSSSSVDVIITDSFGRSADDAAESVSALVQMAGPTPVLLCTGYSLPVEALQQAGISDIIRKPFDPDVFLTQIGKLCNGS